MSKYFEATVKFINNGDVVEGMIFKNGDVNEYDNGIFCYIENDNDMETLSSDKGALDFIVLNYKKL